jgi:hypothetical protein
LSELRIRVVAENAAGSRLKEKLTEKVTALGFAVVDTTAPSLTLKASLSVAPFDRGLPQWKYYQWKGDVQLSDADGRVLGGATPSGQEGQLLDDTARAKATEAGDEGVGQEAARLLSQQVFGQ